MSCGGQVNLIAMSQRDSIGERVLRASWFSGEVNRDLLKALAQRKAVKK